MVIEIDPIPDVGDLEWDWDRISKLADCEDEPLLFHLNALAQILQHLGDCGHKYLK